MNDWDAWYAANGFPNGWSPELLKLILTFVVEAKRVLELGTGAGGNIEQLRHLRFPYHGIEGSETAVKRLHEEFPDLREQIVLGDFTRDLVFGGDFDLIFDRASVPHNDSESIRRCIGLVRQALKPGGIFIACDWFSTGHSEFARGEKLESHTCTGYQDGQFADIGKVHFSDEAELIDLFSDFEGVHLMERTARRIHPNILVPHPVMFRWIAPAFGSVDYRSVVWDIVVRKPL